MFLQAKSLSGGVFEEFISSLPLPPGQEPRLLPHTTLSGFLSLLGLPGTEISPTSLDHPFLSLYPQLGTAPLDAVSKPPEHATLAPVVKKTPHGSLPGGPLTTGWAPLPPSPA